MRKSLALQAELTQAYGTCVFDVTLDCEDGAPVGGELEHAVLVAELATEALNKTGAEAARKPRVAVRLHPVQHPAFAQDARIILGAVGADLCHVMLPKVECLADVDQALSVLDAAMQTGTGGPAVPLHCLIESAQAVQQAHLIAAHPRVQSLSFGLMDFVSAHGGAIPASAMGFAAEPGPADALDQFQHPLVLRAKLEIAAACHAAGKVPSHCVVTEFKDAARIEQAARLACRQLGYTRMWSIHPDQILPILRAFAPAEHELQQACDIILAAQQADWAPISVHGRLHDRASYRYYWQVLVRAYQTGRLPPQHPAQIFFD